ncbi:hypothetical protein HZB00_00065, partial [Candidatus Woesearchaeota archaeon]|nr:hypothetical protein [Candidatus Woesearchaeota archaeon]
EKDQFRLISPYGNIGSYDVTKIINAEWLYGMNMTYKKEVCKEIKFDENLLGYTVAEDTDFSYRVFKKYPNGLFITPYAHAVHRIADNERGNYRKRSFINQVDHFYLFSKHFNNSLKQRIIFVWSLLGIVLLRTLSLFSFKEPQYEKFRYFWVSLAYCISNWSRIKQGKVREF